MRTRNIYIHIPFCNQKCTYCKFALTPVYTDTKIRRYLAHLKNEIGLYFESIPKDAFEHNNLYFGGGTPSILTGDQLREIFEAFPAGFLRKDAEVTLECNPEDITLEYLKTLTEPSINRISIGIQSLQERTLQLVGRKSVESIFSALNIVEVFLGKGGRISVNVDFILGLPGTKYGEIKKNIALIHEKYPFITHTSVYMLEDGLYPKDWKDLSISESEMEEEYASICHYFEKKGWNHYEISNWAIPGYESKHNQGYWNQSEYRGFGLSAASYIDSTRFENSESFEGYYRSEKSYSESLTKEQIRLEKTIYGLRTFNLSRTGFSDSLLSELEEQDCIAKGTDKILLTPTGIFKENFILGKLVEEF